MHCINQVIFRRRLRDGSKVYEFIRSNPHWNGVGAGATSYEVMDVLTPRMLERLVAKEGVCILYTHLGKVRTRRPPFPAETVKSLRDLSRFHHEGKILVTTTRRLLDTAALCERLLLCCRRSETSENRGEYQQELVLDQESSDQGRLGRNELLR